MPPAHFHILWRKYRPPKIKLNGLVPMEYSTSQSIVFVINVFFSYFICSHFWYWCTMWQCICIQCIQGGAYWSEGVWRWKKEAGYNRSGNTRWAGTVKGKKRGKCVGEKPRKTTIYSIMMVSCHFFALKMAHTFSMYRKISQRKINKNPIKSPSDPPNSATKVNTG